MRERFPAEFPQLRRVFEAMHDLHGKYVRDAKKRYRAKNGRDCAWWLGERANVGMLASAAWAANVPAVAEYVDNEGGSNRPVDLWLGTKNQSGLRVEAKSRRMKLSGSFDAENFVKRVNEVLDEALDQIDHVDKECPRLALLFVVVKLKGGATDSAMRDWACVREKIDALAVPDRFDLQWEYCLAMADSFPEERGHCFPGIFVFGRLAGV
jgi:hypothetical protein